MVSKNGVHFVVYLMLPKEAARDNVSPPKVNEKNISSINSIISLFPATADTG